MDANQSLYGALKSAGNPVLKHTAIIYKGHRISYKTLLNRVDNLADSLYNFGIKKGEIVIICLPNIPECAYLLYSVNKIGAVAYLIHALTGANRLEETIKKTSAKIVFTLDSFAQNFEETAKKNNVKLVSVKPVNELNFAVKGVYNIANKSTHKACDYHTFLRENSGKNSLKFACESSENIDVKSTAVLLDSGGTSGDAKTVELSAFAINSLCRNTLIFIEQDNFHKKNMLSALPYFHGFGIAMGLHAVLSLGGCVVMLPKFRRREAMKYILSHKVNYIIGVPAIYSALLAHPRFNGKRISSLKRGFVGGDFVPQSLLDNFDKRLKEAGTDSRLFEGYGLTETVTVLSVNTFSHNKPRSVGRPIECVKVKTFMTDKAIEFCGDKKNDANNSGEICVCGDTVMNGYYKDEKATAESFFFDDEGEKWLKTGDYGHIDDENFIFFKQRLKRIIKVGGASVFPSEIEEAVFGIDGITKVCALDIKDLKKGNAVLLAVETPLSDTSALMQKILDKITQNLNGDSYPKEIVFLKEFPLTKLNKIDCAALKEEIMTKFL